MFRTYIWLEGEGFDPVAFQSAAGGTVEKRYRMNQSVKELAGTYWKSPERRDLTVHDLDNELRELLLHFRPIIETLPPVPSVRVCAEVVQEYDNRSVDVSGAFFSHATLRLLAELRADLDFDIVPRVQ